MPINQETKGSTPQASTSDENRPKSAEAASTKQEHRQVAAVAGRIEPKAESKPSDGDERGESKQSASCKDEQKPSASMSNTQNGSKKVHATDTRPDATSKEAAPARE